jgi:hypothetical protein
MKLDPIRGDPGLAVNAVEEADAHDGCSTREHPETSARKEAALSQNRRASLRHSILEPRPGRTSWIWKLDDHRPRRELQVRDHEVNVAIALDLRLDQPSLH